jgi:hypothetical protein
VSIGTALEGAELAGEARLADADLAEQREEPSPPLGSGVETGEEPSPLGVAPDDRRAHDLTHRLTESWRDEGRLTDGPVLVQEPAAGPLAMVQAVFDHGRLVAAHANE